MTEAASRKALGLAPLYTISIVTHNSMRFMERCFNALLNNSPIDDIEIIVSDNASSEPVVGYLQSLVDKGYPVGIKRNQSNIGYLRAQNAALQYARGLWFVLLNPSAEVPAGWLDKFRAEFSRNPKLGICGVQGVCESLDAGAKGYIGGKREYVETSCAMLSTRLACQVGLYDEGFRFGYCEDVDLSFRLRDRGYELAWAPFDIHYIRGSHAVRARAEESLDMDGFLAYNQKRMTQKWKKYFERRTFKETALVRRAGAIGDVLLSTCAIRELKRRHAHWEVDVETSVPEVFARNPDVRGAVGKADSAGYDHVYDLNDAYEKRPGTVYTSAYGEVMGIEVVDRRPRIYPSQDDRDWAKTSTPPGKCAVIHATSGNPAMPGRNWPAAYYAELSQKLTAAGMDVVAVGERIGVPPMRLARDLRGRTTLHRLAAVIERANVFIGTDSLPAHLAAAALVPSAIIEGSVDPKLTLMPEPYIKAVRDETLGCLGCHHVFPVPSHGSGCLRSSVVCMERVTPDKVMQCAFEVMAMMGERGETPKIRERALPFLSGDGVDIGCGRAPIKPDCLTYDDDYWPEVGMHGDCRRLPFRDGQFDWLYSSHCLEDMTDAQAVLGEWLRTVKPGGLLVLYLPHPELWEKSGHFNSDHQQNGFTPEQLRFILSPYKVGIVDEFIHDTPSAYSTFMVARKNA